MIYIDGCAKGNPGPAAIGIYICDEYGNVLYRGGEYLGEKTNQEAEYGAVLKALNVAPAHCTHDVEIYSDSQLVVKQMNRQFRIRKKHLLDIHKEIRNCEKIFKSVQYIQVEKEHPNIEIADQLAHDAIKRTLRGG